MTETKQKSTRRAFFLQGSAVLGAGVATTVAAATAATAAPKATDVEPIRQLHVAFTTLIEQQNYEAAAELFIDDGHLELSGASANGKRAIQSLFATQYREQQGSAFHSAYRQGGVQTKDVVTLSDDGRRASATFHVEAEVCTPLQADCTIAQMARMQGHVADRRWEAGRFEAKYVKAVGQWKVASLRYFSS